MTTAEAAEALDRSIATVRRLIKIGDLRAWHEHDPTGGLRWYVDDDSVMSIVDERQRDCLVCFDMFTALQPKQIYCSRRCSQRASHQVRAGRSLSAPPRPDPRRRWTREGVIEAIQRWAWRWGEAPSAQEWTKSPPASTAYRALSDQSARPSVNTVTRLFGSWRSAIAAAGLEARRPLVDEDGLRSRILDAVGVNQGCSWTDVEKLIRTGEHVRRVRDALIAEGALVDAGTGRLGRGRRSKLYVDSPSTRG